MTAGIRFRNDDGSIYMDFTTYTGAFLGSFTATAPNSGSIQVPALVGKRLLTFCPSLNLNGQGFGGPVVSLNSATGVISWSFPGTAQGGSATFTVYYGYY